jgi:hypothetical protein
VGAAAQSAALAAELEPDTTAVWRPHVTDALGMTAFWSGARPWPVPASSACRGQADHPGERACGVMTASPARRTNAHMKPVTLGGA